MPDANAIPARHINGAVDLSSLVDRHQRSGEPGQGRPTAAATGQAAPGAAAPGSAGPGPAAPGPGEPVASLPDAVVDADPAALEQFAPLSQFVPVLVEMHAAWSSDAQALSPVLAKLVRELGGRIVLLRIDLDAHPSAGRQPQVLALIGGRPLQLFAGLVPERELRELLAELLEAAASQGVVNVVAIESDGVEADPAASTEPQLPEYLVPAYEALEARDYPAAIAAFERVITERPADPEPKTGLAQAKLLGRLDGSTLAEIRERAATDPGSVEAQLAVADLDLSGGHIEDAFDRLLTVFPKLDADAKTTVRERLLEFFLIVGDEDARVLSARRRLTNLLF